MKPAGVAGGTRLVWRVYRDYRQDKTVAVKG